MSAAKKLDDGELAPDDFDLDDASLKVIDGIFESIIKTTQDAVEQIMDASKGFLSNDVGTAIRDFHLLYSDETSAQTTDINKEVDDLIASIEQEMASGAGSDAAISNVTEDADKRDARLSLAAVQKKLETIIQFDSKARERLVPVIMSMQFEDEIRQVLHRLITVWSLSLQTVNQGGSVEKLKEKLSNMSSTTFEKELLYRIVLKKEPPKSIVDEDSEMGMFLKGLL